MLKPRLTNRPPDKKLGIKWRSKTDYPYEVPLVRQHPHKKPTVLTPNYGKWLGTHRTILKGRKK